MRRVWLVLPAGVFALPLSAALPIALSQGLDAAAWQRLMDDPQTPRALVLSLQCAVVSTLAALGLACVFVTHLHGSRLWPRLVRALGPMLAVPHAAFAVGLALLIMPAGVLARLLAAPLGWASPPAWSTVQDPQGWGLIAVLIFKELPFLLWHLVALLARPELAAQVRGWLVNGQTLGYAESTLWWRVLWPLLLPRLAWPLLAVLAYGLTVVDLALIIGPTSPPTLAVVAWQLVQDGDPVRNAEGMAAAVLLSGMLVALMLLFGLLARTARWPWLRLATSGRRPAPSPARALLTRLGWQGLVWLYLGVISLLALSSIAGVWTFPALQPLSWTAGPWLQVLRGASTWVLSIGLGVLASLIAVALSLLWFECTPASWDGRVMSWVLAPLVIPPMLLQAGLYTLALPMRLDGHLLGLVWVHTLAVLPYVFVSLAPAWRSFDLRFEHTALALGRSRAAFWWHVKLPLLGAPASAALAVGFAVSIAQYLPTQFMGAGRLTTITTEAVTLASGGQRDLASAYAVLQALLPAIAFAWAAWIGQRRRGLQHGA